MSDLVDLKYTPAEIKEEKAESTVGYSQPEYPWGLQIRLEDEELTKLGIKSLPQVGAEFHMTVIAEVTGVNQSLMASGDDQRCVTLQITMASVDLQESADEEAAEKASGKSTPKYEMAEGRSILNRMGKPAQGDN